MIAAYVVPSVLVAIVLVVVVYGWISISRRKKTEAELIVRGKVGLGCGGVVWRLARSLELP